MSGDWMKIEHATPDKPEVMAIASRLGISADEAFGICFRMWRWFDQHTRDGNAPGVSLALVERYIGVSGFAQAALEVGWLEVIEGEQTGVKLPNFDRHNGKTSKQRSLTAKRVSKHYKKHKDANATPNDHPNGKSVSFSSLLFSSLDGSGKIPPTLKTEAFAKAWDAWVKHRAEIKKPLHATMVEAQLKMLASKGPQAAVAMMNHTVAMGWQGLREPESRQSVGGASAVPVKQPTLSFEAVLAETQPCKPETLA